MSHILVCLLASAAVCVTDAGAMRTESNSTVVRESSVESDFVVCGGGLAGVCAAVSAARHGAKVVLVQDRPVLGGNASSEMRMGICGAHGDQNYEAGILEEMQLENLYRNPLQRYSLWDDVVYSTVFREKNITLLLNTSVDGVEMDGGRIAAVKAWNSNSYTRYVIRGRLFADCTGDANAIRHELKKIAYGVWAYMKNHPDGRCRGYDLDWIGSLPGKRESTRFVGPHILTQGDVLSGGHFEDVVAYGGWTLDDHDPDAFHRNGRISTEYRAPSPFGIPFDCLYSVNVPNLMFAGRDISATHMGLSATRVMATCAMLGHGPYAVTGVTATNLATKSLAGTAVGFIGIFAYASVIFSGVVMGALAERFGGWNVPFVTMIGVAVLGAGFFALLWRSKATGYERRT